MGFIGDIFHGIGNLLSGHSWGHTDQAPAAPVQMPRAPAAQQAAPQGDTVGARPSVQSMTPSFLAAAAMPQQGQGQGAGQLQSNVTGKTTLGQ